MDVLLWEGQMAVGLIMQFSDVDAAKHDAMMKEAGHAVWPAGIISHAAGPTADGWCVVDVWSSQAQFDRFLSKRLKPPYSWERCARETFGFITAMARDES